MKHIEVESMQVILLEETIQFDNHAQVIEPLFQMINDRLANSEYHFSHLLVDGIEVYDDFAEYIEEHIGQIKTIEVIVKTVKQLTHDILISAETYVQRATPEINHLIDELYQGPTEQTWLKFQQFLEGIEWINQMLVSIDQSTYHPHNWEEFLPVMATLQMELKNLEESMQSGDYILIADIIQYEFLEQLNKLNQVIKTTIDHEVIRDDTN